MKEFKLPKNREKDPGIAEKAWEIEARALDACNSINHPHIIKCLAAIRKGTRRYFLFPWADGQSLRDYWDTTGPLPKSQMSNIISQTIKQFREISDALDALHSFEGKPKVTGGLLQVPINTEREGRGYSIESIRHGDLKPENLLRFLENNTELGVLRIADMGLARRHIASTLDRKAKTTQRYSTVQYEAPEGHPDSRSPRSRLYDVWSMGVIFLEFLIWVLYGNAELVRFITQFKGNQGQLYKMCETGKGKIPRIHPAVVKWMEHIWDSDPACKPESAIRDLLELVREKLLVIRLPPNRPTKLAQTAKQGLPALDPNVEEPGCRATAKHLRKRLDDILLKMEDKVRFPDYLLIGEGRERVHAPEIMLTSSPSTDEPRVCSLYYNQIYLVLKMFAFEL